MSHLLSCPEHVVHALLHTKYLNDGVVHTHSVSMSSTSRLIRI